ncbi:hypothetical protein [Sulfidibacter corallicola]|uniref:Uncharacterized protein n=1 Tax=Sulfidibacter corallicola TaxID=2818388 RepID=A0A8A4TPN8_SULCO|nr:hypothetical protein [Sulfidibacter corallicola]QTD50938.1 hypothetical protein J3U87_00585 [Sulfidibacter corallicola]
MNQSGVFNLSWVLPSSNLDQEGRNDGNQESQDHDVTPNADPFLASDVVGNLLIFRMNEPWPFARNQVVCFFLEIELAMPAGPTLRSDPRRNINFSRRFK